MAHALAQAGWRVLGLDKRVHPRAKTCGGCLSRRAETIVPFPIASSARVGVREVAITFKGESTIEYRLGEPFAYMVRREEFDHFLVEKAIEAGAVVLQGEEAVSFEGRKDGISVETRSGRCYWARVLVGADGVQSMVARTMGQNYRFSSCLAFDTEMDLGAACSGDRLWIDIGWVGRGYGWVFPKGSSCSVGIADTNPDGMRLKKALSNLFASHPLLRGNMPRDMKAYRIPLSNADNRGKSIVGDRVALVGDAAGLVEPLTGEGIYYAVWSGLALARCLIGCGGDALGAMKGYEHAIRAELHPEFAAAEQVARILYAVPWVTFHLIRRYPGVIARYLDVLMGRSSFLTLLSLLKNKLGLRDSVTGGV